MTHSVGEPAAALAPVRGRVAAPAVLFAGLVLVHGILGLPMQQPHLFPDELGYLGQARYVAGAGTLPDMGATQYYHFGYSLLLVPAFVLFDTPALAYGAAVVTNAFLAGALFATLYLILARWPDVSRHAALGIAFTTCLYPAFVLQPNFAWAENALLPGYALCLVAFATLLRDPAVWRGAVFALIAGFLYALHPRALPLLPISALVLCALAWRREIGWRSALAGFAVLMLAWLIVDVIGGHLSDLGWSSGARSVSAGSFLGRLGSPERLIGALRAGAGQLLYLVLATCGVVLAGPIWLTVIIRRSREEELSVPERARRVRLAAFALLTSLALLATSAIAVSSGGTRSDHLMYGRYNEMFLPFWLAFGLVALSRTPRVIRLVPAGLLVLLVIGALTAGVVTVWHHELLTRDFVAPNIFGIYALVRAMGHVDVLAMSLVSSAIFLMLLAAFHRGTAAGLTLIGVVFTAGAVSGYRYCTAAQSSIASRDDVPARIRTIGDVRDVSYDIAQPITQRMDFGEDRAERYFSTQFLLPHTRVHRFSSERGEKPPVPLVISTRTWKDARALGARYVTSERGAETALWVLPASRHYFAAAEPYVDTSLGWRWFPGVWESGFHATERDRAGRFRWTDGRATLVVPVNEFPARLVTHLSPSRPLANVRVIVNGVELWNGPYPAGRQSLDLGACPVSEWVTIQLESDAIVPREETPESRDERTLGVAVREVRLATR